MWNVAEQPYTLIITAAAVLLILLIIRSFVYEKFKWYYFLLPVIIAAGGFGIDHFIVTDKEQIQTVLGSLSKAVENEQPQLIDPFISEDYSDSIHQNKEIFMYKCRASLSTPFIKKAILQLQDYQINPTQADLTFSARIILEPQSYIAKSYKDIFFAILKMKLTKNNGNWKISNIEIEELDFQKTGWKDISSYAY
jgi:hypothetical protein